MRTKKKGLTLIEVTLSLVILFIVITLGFQLLAQGLKKPFIMERAEPWLTFMENVNQAIQKLPRNDPLLEDGERFNPFPQLFSGLGVKDKDFKLKWRDYELSGNCSGEDKACLLSAVDYQKTGSLEIKAALLSATTRQGKEIFWRVYRIFPSRRSE